MSPVEFVLNMRFSSLELNPREPRSPDAQARKADSSCDGVNREIARGKEVSIDELRISRGDLISSCIETEEDRDVSTLLSNVDDTLLIDRGLGPTEMVGVLDSGTTRPPTKVALIADF